MTQAEWMMLWLCALAALLHGLSGFGFPMMSTAVLSSEYPLSMAVTLVILPCLLLNLIMLNADPQHGLFSSMGYYLQTLLALNPEQPAGKHARSSVIILVE